MESDKEELKKYLKKSSIDTNLDEKEIGFELKTNFEALEQGRFPEKLLEEVKKSDSIISNDIMKEIEAKHTEILKGRPMPELLESAEMIESLQEINPPAMGKLYEEKKEINLNSGVLSDKTLNLVFKDIEKHLLKKNIKLI